MPWVPELRRGSLPWCLSYACKRIQVSLNQHITVLATQADVILCVHNVLYITHVRVFNSDRLQQFSLMYLRRMIARFTKRHSLKIELRNTRPTNRIRTLVYQRKRSVETVCNTGYGLQYWPSHIDHGLTGFNLKWILRRWCK